MRSQADLINRFRDGARTGAASNMFIEGDILYSYGQHFPLAVRRKWGASIAYLINGDRYSISTASHQRQCITKLTPNVQVPFSALIAAGLTDWQRAPRSELRIAAHQSDRHFETCAHCGREAIGARGATGDPPTWAYRHADDATPLCSAAEQRAGPTPITFSAPSFSSTKPDSFSRPSTIKRAGVPVPIFCANFLARSDRSKRPSMRSSPKRFARPKRLAPMSGARATYS